MLVKKSKEFFSKKTKKTRQYTLLVKEIELDDRGYAKAIIQVVGKPVFFPYKIKDLVKDEKMLRQFPLEQIKTLVTLSCNESTIPVYQISAVDMELDSLIVKEIITGKFFTLAMNEINQPLLWENFSKEDVFKMGNLYTDYHNKLEYESLCDARKARFRVVK